MHRGILSRISNPRKPSIRGCVSLPPEILTFWKKWTSLSESKFDANYDFPIQHGLVQLSHQLIHVQSSRRKVPKRQCYTWKHSLTFAILSNFPHPCCSGSQFVFVDASFHCFCAELLIGTRIDWKMSTYHPFFCEISWRTSLVMSRVFSWQSSWWVMFRALRLPSWQRRQLEQPQQSLQGVGRLTILHHT